MTFEADEQAEKDLQILQTAWGVTRGEAIRRALRQAASYEVEAAAVIADLPERRHDRDVTDAAWSALRDQAVLDDPAMGIAIGHMMRGERPRWNEKPDGSRGPAE